MDYHEWLKIAGGVAGFLMYLPLVRHAVRHNGAGQSFAMWFLWAVLDTTLTLSIVVQHGNYLLSAGFAVGSILLSVVLFAKGRRSWGRLENVVSALVVLCLAVWVMSGPRMATVSTTVAIVIAGLPGAVALWRNPQRGVALPWLGYVLANGLAFVGGTDWSIAERFAPGVFVVQTLVMAAIGFRPRPPAHAMKTPG